MICRTPERGGGRHAGQLFYSDLILEVLRLAARQGPVLAAGDFNEARGWDDHHDGHTWGAEFFSQLEDAGLHNVTHDLWNEERTTRFDPEHRSYQLDFVVATPDVAATITHAEVDSGWTVEVAPLAELADHAPLWFDITPDAVG